ncbi:MAG: preprotein translocase subunit SecE [Steroidobacteraceae bacterium]
MNEQVQEQGGGGTAMTVVAALLVLAGVAAYYVLGNSNVWLRWAAVVAGLALGGLVFTFSAQGRAFARFIAEARIELRKVIWPSKQDTWQTTAVVFGFVVISGVFFWVLDLFLAWATKLLSGQGG